MVFPPASCVTIANVAGSGPAERSISKPSAALPLMPALTPLTEMPAVCEYIASATLVVARLASTGTPLDRDRFLGGRFAALKRRLVSVDRQPVRAGRGFERRFAAELCAMLLRARCGPDIDRHETLACPVQFETERDDVRSVPGRKQRLNGYRDRVRRLRCRIARAYAASEALPGSPRCRVVGRYSPLPRPTPRRRWQKWKGANSSARSSSLGNSRP